jgi:Tfp pilus assembly protein PilO
MNFDLGDIVALIGAAVMIAGTWWKFRVDRADVYARMQENYTKCFEKWTQANAELEKMRTENGELRQIVDDLSTKWARAERYIDKLIAAMTAAHIEIPCRDDDDPGDVITKRRKR